MRREKEEAEERKLEEGVVDEAEGEVKEVFTLSGEEERKKRREERKVEHERRMNEGVKECEFLSCACSCSLSLSMD